MLILAESQISETLLSVNVTLLSSFKLTDTVWLATVIPVNMCELDEDSICTKIMKKTIGDSKTAIGKVN